ncbi:MAG: hypothetical protein QMD82_02620 [bacterium]|nr:hypothetical protein [bacterium]
MSSLIFCLILFAQNDPWWAKDKVRHFATAYILTKAAMQTGMEKKCSAGIVISLSVAKEIYDKKVKKSSFSFKDLLYDLGGIAFGYLL